MFFANVLPSKLFLEMKTERKIELRKADCNQALRASPAFPSQKHENSCAKILSYCGQLPTPEPIHKLQVLLQSTELLDHVPVVLGLDGRERCANLFLGCPEPRLFFRKKGIRRR